MAIVVSVLREVEREARVRLFVFTTYCTILGRG